MNTALGAGLEGRGVIVTGAAGAIGRAVSCALASCGARVIAVDMEHEKVDDVVASLDGDGHHSVAADLTDLSTHDEVLTSAMASVGSVRALVNLAAVLRRRPDLESVTEDDWDVQVAINQKATFFLARSAAKIMSQQEGGGRIVLFSSQGWWTGGFGGSVVYNATKGAIVTMARGLARTLGPEGITVNAVAPGLVSTPMLLTDLDEELLGSLIASTPLGRIAEPEEIAGTVVFLVSDHARYITGATINVSGGFLMY